MKNIVLVCVLICGISRITWAQDWEQMVKVVAPDRKTGDQFGFGMAMSGDWAIIGSYRHDFDENGMDSLRDAGAAYIFQRNDCDWVFAQKLVASDRAMDDFFGYFVEIEGDYVMVGAFQEDHDEDGNNLVTDAGSVYVFQNTGGVWSETQKLVASDREPVDNFGLNVAISGEYAVIGAYREDEDEDGLDSLLNAGSAYVFELTGGVWSEVQKIAASERSSSDWFGIDVDIDGDFIVVGAENDDEDADGLNFLMNAGSAFIFENIGGTWTEVQKIVSADRASNDWFGHDVVIDGNWIACGSPNNSFDEFGLNEMNASGAAYIFEYSGATWTQVKKAVAADRAASDNFGNRITLQGDYALISAYREAEDCDLLNTMANSGSAYMFVNDGGWSQAQKICRSDREPLDFFSLWVAIDGDQAMISASLDDEDEEEMDSLNNAGSAYFFSLGECVPADLDIISVQDGNWNDPDTWDCACVPDSTDRVEILATHTVSVTDNQGCDSLIVDDGGRLNIYDSLVIRGGAVFWDTVYVESVLMGDGDKLVEEGGVLLSGGILAGSGKLEIADGGELSFLAFVENQFYLTIRNHGTINWNAGYYTNSACGAFSTIINESDGVFNIGGDQFHFLSNTNVINYGEMNVSTETRFNYGCPGDNGYFNNQSTGVVNVTNSVLYLHGDGTHSGMFNVSDGASLNFAAKMILATDGNVAGEGVLAINDSTIINIPYIFAIDSIYNAGNITGTGDKTLPSGAIMASYGVLSGDGELTIEDGAELSLLGFPEIIFCLDIINHGTLRWSSGYYSNSICPGVSDLLNASDGEIIFDGELGRFLSNTNVTNYGVINKYGDFEINCGAEGYFNNVSPGVINIHAGTVNFNGNGTHSGIFNNSGTLGFSANHEMTTAGNLMGTGDIVIYDSMTIDIPYTFPAAEITLNGVLHGMGDKTMPSGSVFNMNNACDFHSELVIENGAVLNYTGVMIGDSIRNHGTFNWLANNINACRAGLATFINEIDGEIVIPASAWLARTILINYGHISKTGDNVVYFNSGCGNDGYFNNLSTGVVDIHMGNLQLRGNGTHSGTFNNSAVLEFNANHEMTTAGNLTGTGDINIHDTMRIDIPFTFPVAEISLYGTFLGMADKTLPSGSILNMYSIWKVEGELEVADGAVLNYNGGLLSDTLRNHGVVNWAGGSLNGCGDLCTFINEADGEFVITGLGSLARTNLTNHGLITKNTANDIYFNNGCGNDGYFHNVAPGVVNNLMGQMQLFGNGTHSGTFNNSGLLIFNANHEMTTADNLTGNGDIHIHDSMWIDIHYTFPEAEITLYGTFLGIGDKTLPSGSILNMYNTWNVDGELEIADGASLNYSGSVIGDTIRNHGLFNWLNGNINVCRDELAMFYNESDGDIQIPALGYIFLGRTNLVNYGSIAKTGEWVTYFNAGCGNDGYFNNISPGVVSNSNAQGALSFDGDGTHSGTFYNDGIMIFNADHEMTTDGNMTGSGGIHIYDTMSIDIPYTFPAAELTLYGTFLGIGDKTLPSGSILNMYNTWNVDGELEVADGAVLNYSGSVIGDTIRNHGVFNWLNGNINTCRDELAMFYNESDGDIQIPALGYIFLGRTNLLNHGSITKSGNWVTYFNAGCGDDGYFNNISPGVISNTHAQGVISFDGDGTHSGTFNNDGLMIFNADHEVIAPATITGSGDWHIYDTTTINSPFTIGIDSTSVYGVLGGSGDLTLPLGNVLNSFGPLSGSGDLHILDGATLHFLNSNTSYCSYDVHNHGLVTWNSGPHFNACSALTSFTNESTGELILGGTGDRYFANTHLINYGLITKDTDATIHMNEDGSCGGTAGMFDNVGPGVLNVLQGIFLVR